MPRFWPPVWPTGGVIVRSQDDGIQAGNKTILVWVAVAVAAVVLAGWGARWLYFYYMQWTADRLAASVQAQIFEHIHRLPMSFYESTDVGTLISRLTNDVDAMRTLFSSGLSRMIRSVIVLVGGAILMFLLDWKMTLFTLAVIPLLAAMMTVYRRFATPYFLKMRDAIADVTSCAQRNLGQMTFIQSYNQQIRHIGEFSEVNDENRAA